MDTTNELKAEMLARLLFDNDQDEETQDDFDLSEKVAALSKAFRFNPVSGARMAFEVLEALAADPEAKVSYIEVTVRGQHGNQTFFLNKHDNPDREFGCLQEEDVAEA